MKDRKPLYPKIEKEKKVLTEDEVSDILGYDVEVVDNHTDTVVNILEGDAFRIGNVEFLVLAGGVYTIVIAKDPIASSSFGDTNDFKSSDVRRELLDFQQKVSKMINKDGMKDMMVPLQADNGSEEYGFSVDKVTLPTIFDIRKYADILLKNIPSDNWWLATPHGTQTRGGDSDVCYVNKDGMLEHMDCTEEAGIRPMMMLKYDVKVILPEK